MKNKILIAPIVSILALLALGINIGGQPKVSTTWYKAKERDYKAASEAAAAKKGCESIPFSSAKRCRTVYDDMKVACDSKKRSCADQVPLLKAAIKSKDKPEITKIRKVCAERVDQNQMCQAGRDRVQDFFRNANDQVEQDLRDFRDKLKTARGTDKTMFENLIRYAEAILAHYRETEESHSDEIAKVESAMAACNAEIKKADAALK